MKKTEWTIGPLQWPNKLMQKKVKLKARAAIRPTSVARTPESLPYFGPLGKVPDSFLAKHFAFSRVPGAEKQYVQDKMREDHEALAAAMQDPKAHFFVCGLKAMDDGVEQAFEDIGRKHGLDWATLRSTLREEGRYHVETY